jgi:hypothetical protein
MAEIIDFLRRLASMMAGGRNAEMLLDAAGMIETLSRRAAAAERLYLEQEEDHTKSLERREIAEVAADNLIAEVAALKAEFAESKQQAAAEISSLHAEIAGRDRQPETDRTAFAEERLRLRASADDAEARLAGVAASLEALRNPVKATEDSVALVPIQSLQLARAQFGFLADGFAGSGDVVSQTICEIAARAIENTLAGQATSKEPKKQSK